MTGILLDTNILVDWLKYHRRSRPKNDEQRYNSENAKNLIGSFINEDVNICISCHTLKELLQYPNISAQEEDRISTLLPTICKVLPTTIQAARVAGYLSRQSASYREHHIEDCYIAATAISFSLPLYTRNPDDFNYVPHTDLIVKVPYNYHHDIVAAGLTDDFKTDRT